MAALSIDPMERKKKERGIDREERIDERERERQRERERERGGRKRDRGEIKERKIERG